jgi:hypothetical protein
MSFDPTKAAAFIAQVEALEEGLSWALDLIDLYDERLVELGEPRDLVYSPIHLAGKAKARGALAEAP